MDSSLLDAIPLEIRHWIMHWPQHLVMAKLTSPEMMDQLAPTMVRLSNVSSSVEAQSMLKLLQERMDVAEMAQSLTVMRGDGLKAASVGKRKRAGGEPTLVEDSVTELELVQLLMAMGNLEQLHLREVAFTSLRRRSLSDLTTSGLAARLHTLSISGRPGTSPHASDTMFNLHTVGQLVLAFPLLRHLALRHVHASPSSLEHLTPYPSCTLTSFALFSTPNLTSKHLHWLLRATCHAETLRTLALEWDDSPRILNPIRYTVLRVEELHLTTRTPEVAEAFALHCPSLVRFTMSSSAPVDAARLFANLETPLLELHDRSEGVSGVDPRLLAAILDGGELKNARQLKVVSIAQTKAERRLRNLTRVVQLKGIELQLLDNTSELCIPEAFASLRDVDLTPVTPSKVS